MSSESGQRNVLWVILAVALVLRAALAFLAWPFTHITRTHTASYVEPAVALLTTGSFLAGGEPDIVRTPAFPLLLLPGLALGFPAEITIALQILLSVATVWLVWRIALTLTEDATTAGFAAGLYALEPLSILFASTLLTETLFGFLLALGLYLVIQGMKTGSLAYWAGAGAAIALSTYARPISVYLPVLLALGLVLVPWRQPLRSRLSRVAVLCLVSLSLTGLWQLRNYRLTGYSGFSAISDINLYYYQAASVIAAIQDVSYFDVQERMGYGDGPEFDRTQDLAALPTAERYATIRQRGAGVLLEHPLVYARIHLEGLARILLDPGAVRYLRLLHLYPKSGGLLGDAVDKGLLATFVSLMTRQPLVFWAHVVLGLVLLTYLTLLIPGLLHRPVWGNPGWLVTIAVSSYLFVVSGGPHGEGRFRHPVMLGIVLLGGVGLARMLEWRRSRQAASGKVELSPVVTISARRKEA